MKMLCKDTQQMLDALQKAVDKTLDRKKRLGQYAVVEIDGKITYLYGQPSAESEQPDTQKF